MKWDTENHCQEIEYWFEIVTQSGIIAWYSRKKSTNGNIRIFPDQKEWFIPKTSQIKNTGKRTYQILH